MAAVNKQSNNIFITGGAGFVGSHLTELHLNKGDKVISIDNLSTGRSQNISTFFNDKNFTFYEEDIINWHKLNETVAWADRIYHLASSVGNKYVIQDPFNTLMNNMTSCQEVLESMAKSNPAATLVIASSSEVYGFPLASIFNEPDFLCLASPKQTRSEYAMSKAVNESMAKVYREKYDLRIIVLRLFNTIGPNQISDYGMVVPRFIKQAVTGEPLTVIGEGTDKRCFADVRDVVQMINELAGNESVIGKTINVGDDKDISISELAHKIIKLANSHSKIIRISTKNVYGRQFLNSNHRKPNLRLLYSLIKYKPKWDIDKSLLDLIERFRAVL